MEGLRADEGARTRAPRPWRWIAFAGAAIAFGAWLRIRQLGVQILVDDEWHALHMLLNSSVRDILSHFGRADHSIPLTLYYRGLFDLGMLDEWSMRLPLLVAGIALLALVPVLLRGWVGMRTRALLVGLLAISPLHVYLSRTARPYALTCLLGFFAIVAFRRWWRQEPHARTWAAGYALATILAGWLHLLSLVFTLMPFAYHGVLVLGDLASPARRAAGRRALGRLLGLGLATAAPLAALLVPPFVGDWNALAVKAGAGSPSWHAFWRSVLMLFGTGATPVGVAWAAVTAIGLVRAWRRDPEGTGYLVVTALVGAAAILAARPAWIEHPGAFARYALPMLPFLLLFAAHGLAGVLEGLGKTVRRRLAHGSALETAAAAGVLALVFAAGPIPAWLPAPNQFTGHARYVFDYAAAANPYLQPDMLPDLPMPAFYRDLAALPPGSVTVVEAPWRLESNYVPEAYYQPVHRQTVKVGMVTGVCGDGTWGEYPESATGIHLRNAVHLAAILRGEPVGADFLVIRPRPWTIPPSDRERIAWPDMDACLPSIQAALGAPVYRDAQIIVFELAAANRAIARPGR